MDGSYYNLPVLVWDRILEFLSPRELFELTETLPKLLELPDAMSEMNIFNNEHPFVCPKCKPRIHVVLYIYKVTNTLVTYQLYIDDVSGSFLSLLIHTL